VHPFFRHYFRYYICGIFVITVIPSFELFNLDFLIKDGGKLRSLGVLISGTERRSTR